MSWKKNGISYLLWLVYTLFVGIALAWIAGEFGQEFGFPVDTGWGLAAFTAGTVLLSGILVFLFHIINIKQKPQTEGVSLSLVDVALAVVLLLILGLVYRINRIDQAQGLTAYYEAAKVVEGGSISQAAHGAGYLYLQLLHAVFLFFGNKMSAGIWLQIILQLAGTLFLFFGVGKFAGSVAGLVTLGFYMFSEITVQEALELSPRMLYFFLFAVTLDLVVSLCGKSLHPVLFLGLGFWIGLMAELDAGGFLLLIFLTAAAWIRQQKDISVGRRLLACMLGPVGAAAGFFTMIYAVTFLDGEPFWGVLRAWMQLFTPRGYQMPEAVVAHVQYPGWTMPIFLMTLGIFSFWCNKEKERRSVWVMASLVAALAGSLGVFTEELPASQYLFLFFATLSGVSVGDCFWGRRESELKEIVSEMSERSDETEDADMTGEPVKETKPSVAEHEQSDVWETEGEKMEDDRQEAEEKDEKQGSRFIENPLPLPKPHQKRVLDYDRPAIPDQDDFDVEVDENDDFDI